MKYFPSTRLDVRYLVEHKSIEESRDCYEAGCDYICRCSKIDIIEYEDVNSFEILPTFLKKYPEDDPFVIYLIERTLSKANLEVEYSIRAGYYGEEIDSEEIHTPDIKIDEENTHALINAALIQEYGYSLGYEDKDIYYDKVLLKDIIHSRNHPVTTKEYKNKMPSPIDYYGNLYCSQVPLCICIPDGDKYKIIDGNHRIGHLKSHSNFRDKKRVPILLIK